MKIEYLVQLTISKDGKTREAVYHSFKSEIAAKSFMFGAANNYTAGGWNVLEGRITRSEIHDSPKPFDAAAVSARVL